MLGETIYDVAIVGAGPTGLTLANLLGLAGARVLVIERNESTVRAPRAVSIDDESLRTMQAIGLTEEVMRDVAADYGSHYFDRHNRCFLRVEPTTREYGFPRRNAFTQPALEQTLLEGTRRFPNVTLCFCCTVESFTETKAGVLLSAKHADGSEAEFNARYVVGCDGARSTLRKQIGATMVGDTYPQRWLIIDLASTQERLRQTRVVCDPERPFLTLPGPHGIRRYEFMLHDDEDEAHATDPEFVRGLLLAHGPDAGSPVVRRQVYTFHALIADRWNAGRIFLAGDAAHLSPPFAGQGMNSGIRDAFNLGWKLAVVVQGAFGSKLLDTYFEERAPHAAALIQLAVRMGQIMMPRSRVHAWLTQTAFRLMRFAPALQSYFAQMKYKPKPYYRRGFRVGGDQVQLAGRMIAQPTVETLDRVLAPLDQLLGGGFSLVAFGPEAEQRMEESFTLDLPFRGVRRIAILPRILNPQRPPSPGIELVRDLHGALSSLAPEGRTVLMLVRPDRYVAVATCEAIRDFAALLHSLVGRYTEAETASNTVPVAVPLG
jgi:3-(3-hydroxy-phenyl)propionate hydroxylase